MRKIILAILTYGAVNLCQGEEVKGKYYTFTAPSNSVHSTVVPHLESYRFAWGKTPKTSNLTFSHNAQLKTKKEVKTNARELEANFKMQAKQAKGKIDLKIVTEKLEAGPFKGLLITQVIKPEPDPFFRTYYLCLWDGTRAWSGMLMAKSPIGKNEAVEILKTGKTIANKVSEPSVAPAPQVQH